MECRCTCVHSVLTLEIIIFYSMGETLKTLLTTFLCMFFSFTTVYASSLNQVAAVVNGHMISLYDIQVAALPELRKANIDPKKPANKAKVDTVYAAVLQEMILETLVVAEAERQQITASPEEIEAELTRMMQQSRLSKDQFEKRLKSEGLTPDSLREKLRKNIVRQKLMVMMVGRKIVVAPEEVRAYYDTHIDEFKSKSSLRLALLVYPESLDATRYAKEIKAGKLKFADVARKVSIGPNKENGGELGVVPTDKLNPQLVKLLESLNEGESTPLINLQGQSAQFNVIQKTKGGVLMTFEEARPAIENIVREPRLQARFEDYIKQLRQKAVIDIRM